MAWAEDVVAEYFRTEDFADDWTINGVSVRAIFDDEWASESDIEGTTPQIAVPTTQAEAVPVAVGQTAIGPAGTFTVREFHPTGDGPDGKGTTTIILEAS